MNNATDVVSVDQAMNRLQLTWDVPDWAAHRDCLADDVEYCLTMPDGSVATVFRGVDEYMARAREGAAQMRAVQHTSTNHVITIDGDRATLVANVLTHHVALKGEPRVVTVGARTTFEMVRVASDWKLRRLVVVPVFENPWKSGRTDGTPSTKTYGKD